MTARLASDRLSTKSLPPIAEQLTEKRGDAGYRHDH
jgi:hypothetical protein